MSKHKDKTDKYEPTSRSTLPGYHINEIPKGELGKISKIHEELDELRDAEQQGVRIMMGVEMSDIYGALEEYALKHGFTMEDLKAMSDVTKRAFKNGRRS